MKSVKMIVRWYSATTIALLLGLLLMGFHTPHLIPAPHADQYQASCPTAKFTSGGSESGLTTHFNNLSSLAESFSWDFGDGSGSTETNPRHTYASPGAYQVRLTAYSAGCEASWYIGTVEVISG